MSEPHSRYERAINTPPSEGGAELSVDPEEECGILDGSLNQSLDEENDPYFDARRLLGLSEIGESPVEAGSRPVAVSVADRAIALGGVLNYYNHVGKVEIMKRQLGRLDSWFWRGHGAKAPRVFGDAMKERAAMLQEFQRGVHTLAATEVMLANGDDAGAELARTTMRRELDKEFSGTSKEAIERRQQLARQVGDAALLILGNKREQS